MNVIIVLFFATLIGSTYQAEWSYEYETQWPGQCRSGTQQSPINIMTRDAVLDKHGVHITGPLVFRGYGAVNVTAANNGHALQWTLDPGSTTEPTLSGGPLRSNYTFLELHIHWLSEHAIDGMKYPMEIHLVHVKAGVPLEQALRQPDGLAVIGILCQVSHGLEAELSLQELMTVVPDLVLQTSKNSAPKIIDMTRFFSPNPQSFYTYHGSLTTPNCDEVVTWIVMDHPILVSDSQYKLFNKVDVGGVDNYRSLQPTNRVVYRSVASCASMLSPSILGFLVALISCLSSSLTTTLHKGICIISNVKRRVIGITIKDCSKIFA